MRVLTLKMAAHSRRELARKAKQRQRQEWIPARPDEIYNQFPFHYPLPLPNYSLYPSPAYFFSPGATPVHPFVYPPYHAHPGLLMTYHHPQQINPHWVQLLLDQNQQPYQFKGISSSNSSAAEQYTGGWKDYTRNNEPILREIKDNRVPSSRALSSEQIIIHSPVVDDSMAYKFERDVMDQVLDELIFSRIIDGLKSSFTTTTRPVGPRSEGSDPNQSQSGNESEPKTVPKVIDSRITGKVTDHVIEGKKYYLMLLLISVLIRINIG